MGWSNIVLESYCFGEKDKDEKYPCGRKYPTHFCLGDKEKGMCPHFGYVEVFERDAAIFVPIRLVIKDRIIIWADDIWWKLRWFFWDQLSFNRKKMKEFFKEVQILTSEENSVLLEWENEDKRNQEKFEKWIKIEGGE